MHDELNAPLGLGSNPPAPRVRSGAGIFTVFAALVVVVAVFGEAAVLRQSSSWSMVGAASREPSALPVDPPPLRLTQNLEAAAKPPAASERAEPAPPTSPAGRPANRAGAPEPVIIDVQEALAALRTKDSAAIQR